MARGGANSVRWSDAMTEQLLSEADKLENAVVLRGLQYPGQNTTGTTKKAVFERIASSVIPDHYARDPVAAGLKVHNKYNFLCKTYAEKLSLLHVTGGGVGESEDQSADGASTGLQQVHLKYYIDSNGPTADTPSEGVNLWESIARDFKFFPEMHKMLSTRPKQNPVAITTGIGPAGPQTILYQPPSREDSPDWDIGNLASRSCRVPKASNLDNDDSDSDSIYIFPPSSPPPPPGPGKGVDPHERGARPGLVTAKLENVKSAKAGKTNSKVQGAGAKHDKPGCSKVAATTGKEKKTAPRTSKHVANLQSGSTNEPNSRKRKDRDPFMTFAEEFSNQRAKVNSDNAYIAEKRLLLTAASKYKYSKKEFKRRDYRIDMRYGQINVDDSESSDEDAPPTPTPVAGPSRPIDRPSPEPIVLDSSPIASPHPFGTPEPEPDYNLELLGEDDIIPDSFWLPHIPPTNELAPPEA